LGEHGGYLFWVWSDVAIFIGEAGDLVTCTFKSGEFRFPESKIGIPTVEMEDMAWIFESLTCVGFRWWPPTEILPLPTLASSSQ